MNRTASLNGASRSRTSVDVLGVGFGPANLALAVALHETHGSSAFGNASRDAVFLERQHSFAWHVGMLIDGTTMQVSFLKDLVTMRNPTSSFSFAAYLHEAGRLTDFINRGTMYPLRREFHSYLEHVASHFEEQVQYGTEVTAIRPVRTDGVVTHLDVDADGPGGRMKRFRASNVVIGTGLTPRIPEGATLTERVWHSDELLLRLKAMRGDPPRSFVVVGAGQSAAEVVAYLHDTYRDADVHSIMSRMGFSATDDSPLGNRIFDPEAVDAFYEAPHHVKAGLLRHHAATNYSVVDRPMIERLSDIATSEALNGRRRFVLHSASRVNAVTESADGLTVDVEDLPSSAVSALRADVLVYATGYEPSDPTELLGDFDLGQVTDDFGRLRLQRDYRLLAPDWVGCGLYVHGAAAEPSHGLSAGLLSNVAVRAEEIVSSMHAELVQA